MAGVEKPARRDQAGFGAALLDPDAPLPPGLAPSGGVAPRRRFGVYRNNVVASLTKALGQAYPIVKKLVGDDAFAAWAGAHVRAHPPRDPVMALFGVDFPDWLAAHPPAASTPYLADVARLERARLEAYHAADAPALDAAALQERLTALGAEAAGARLYFHPAARLLSSHYPALSIWRAVDADEPCAAMGGEDVLITRPALDVTATPLAPFWAGAAAQLGAGAPLGEAAGSAMAAAEHAGASFDLGALLRTLAGSGALADARLV